MPAISVIIPAYNCAETVEETIESVIAQTYSDLEIIVINDGSTDKTLEILQNIQDDRLKVFSYNNGGLSTARNRGIRLATGKYIAFLDADDLWTADKLESQLLALQNNPDAGLAYSWVYFQYDTKTKSYADTSCDFTGYIYPDLLLKNFIHNGSNTLIRTEVVAEVGNFDPQLKAVEDWDFYLRIAAKHQFVLVPKVQIIYRQSDTSMTANIKQMEYYLEIVIERAFTAAPNRLQYLKPQSFAWMYKYLAQQYLKYQSNNLCGIKQALLNIYRAVRYYPPNILDPFSQSLAKILIKKTLKKAYSFYR